MRALLQIVLIIICVAYFMSPAPGATMDHRDRRVEAAVPALDARTHIAGAALSDAQPFTTRAAANVTVLSNSATTSTTVYLPIAQFQLPRPYTPPGNTVAVVNSKLNCFWWNRYLTECWVVGEVLNTTQAPVYAVEVGQKICDDQGAVVTDTETIFLPALAPGQLGSFGIHTAENPSAGTHLCGPPSVITWSSHSSDSIRPVTVITRTKQISTDEFGYEIVHIGATLRNDSTNVLSPTVATVTLYDRDGYILDTRAYRVKRMLDMGSVVTFTVVFAQWPWYQHYSGQVAYYSVQAQGVTVPTAKARMVEPLHDA